MTYDPKTMPLHCVLCGEESEQRDDLIDIIGQQFGPGEQRRGIHLRVHPHCYEAAQEEE